MTENDAEVRAARSWLQYWKENAADGEQSWLGREDAQEEVMRYRRVIADYERQRAAGPTAEDHSGDSDTSGPASPGDSS